MLSIWPVKLECSVDKSHNLGTSPQLSVRKMVSGDSHMDQGGGSRGISDMLEPIEIISRETIVYLSFQFHLQ